MASARTHSEACPLKDVPIEVASCACAVADPTPAPREATPFAEWLELSWGDRLEVLRECWGRMWPLRCFGGPIDGETRPRYGNYLLVNDASGKTWHAHDFIPARCPGHTTYRRTARAWVADSRECDALYAEREASK